MGQIRSKCLPVKLPVISYLIMSGLLLLLLVPFASSLPYSHYYNYNSYRPAAYVHSPRYLSYPLTYYQGYLPNYNKGFALARSSDFVQQTRTQANSLKNTLMSLSSIPGAKRIINRIINDDDNVCLNSVEEAIEAVETSAKIVESSGTEIKNLIKTVEAFEKLTDTPTVVREAANILRSLEVLIPKLAPANVQICGASNAQAFGSLRSLAALVDELSSTNEFYMPPQSRKELETSAKIISGVTSFLVKPNKSFTKFDKFCTSDKEYNVEAITAIGEMMTGLADLFGVLGGLSDAEQIRKQGDFTKKVVANINKLGDLDLGTLECDTPGSFKVAADTLDDLAGIIEEVGIDKLTEQLGLDLDFNF